MATVVYELSACISCTLLTANGECDPDDTDAIAGYEAWHERNPELHLALGGEHREECTEDDRNGGCDCEDLGFSWFACEVCDVSLGGDRHKLTAFNK